MGRRSIGPHVAERFELRLSLDYFGKDIQQIPSGTRQAVETHDIKNVFPLQAGQAPSQLHRAALTPLAVS
jgi:hypothetical protein